MTSSNNDEEPRYVSDKSQIYSGLFSSTTRVLLPTHFSGFSNLFIAIESLSGASNNLADTVQIQLSLFSQINFNENWVTVRRESKSVSCLPQKKSYDLISIPSEVYLKNILGVKTNLECKLDLILYP